MKETLKNALKMLEDGADADARTTIRTLMEKL